MCTAAAFQTKDFYFGRTLDYECSYGECVTVTPRRYPFSFRHMGRLDAHYAMIGMAHVADGYPLYYDAVNEAGLGMAGLNFVGNAQYAEVREGKENVAQFELIPWILGPLRHGPRGAGAAGRAQSGRHTLQRALSRRAAALAASRQGRGRRH